MIDNMSERMVRKSVLFFGIYEPPLLSLYDRMFIRKNLPTPTPLPDPGANIDRCISRESLDVRYCFLSKAWRDRRCLTSCHLDLSCGLCGKFKLVSNNFALTTSFVVRGYPNHFDSVDRQSSTCDSGDS